MLTAILDSAYNPMNRGYHAVYREGETNHCPGCGRTHWHIGRITAECAFCSTALPLQESRSGVDAEVRTRNNSGRIRLHDKRY